jgi:hypothetical protein
VKTVEQISAKVRVLKAERVSKDSAMDDVYTIRDGRIQDVYPGMFSDDFPESVMQNFTDVAARDVAESLAPLPSFNCTPANTVSDRARARADKRTKGAHYYLERSRVQAMMFTGADYYATYGFMPVLIDPDFEHKCPRIQFENPRGAYYEKDRWGRVTCYARVFQKTIRELMALYPDYAARILGPTQYGQEPNTNAKLDVTLYRDDDQNLLYIPERQDLVLNWAPNRVGECPVVIAERPGVTDNPRGQYDDVRWIQVARNRFTMLAMQAAEQAVEAPWALPMDVQDVALGPMAGLRSNTPEKIRKVGQELPQAAFAEGQLLDQEMKAAARYPGVRTGNLDSSIITGQGVKALEGGYDSQIRAGQKIFAEAFKDIIRLCFLTDEKLWPNEERSIVGSKDNVAYDISWKPSRDIDGEYGIDVSYGMAAGLDPNRALVFMLQTLGANLVSKDSVRRQLPFEVNVTQEEQRIEVEGLRDALIQAVAGYAQAIPILAQSGQDPGEILARLGQIIEGRQKGQALEKVVAEAFAPKQPPQGMPGQEDPLAAMMGGGGGGGGVEGLQASGLPQGIAPGQATMGPGGRPDLVTMLAGLNSGGGPTLNTNVKRSMPV